MSTANTASLTTRIDEQVWLQLCNATGDQKTCIGVTTIAGSVGDKIAVATEGIYLFKAAAAVDAGRPIQPDATDPRAVIEAGSLICTGSTKELADVDDVHSGKRVGYALHSAGSEEYVFVKLAF